MSWPPRSWIKKSTPPAWANARNSRRQECVGLCGRQRSELAVERCHDCRRLQSRTHAFVVWLELTEIHRAARAAGLREQAESGNAGGITHRLFPREERVNLFQHRRGALERGPFRKLNIDDTAGEFVMKYGS